MWTQPKSEDDYALRFPDWWEADIEAMVRKDLNHPSVILYSIGNEIPEAGRPHGARARARTGREGAVARQHPVSSPRPSAGCSSAGAELFAELAETRSTARRPDEETGVNTVMTRSRGPAEQADAVSRRGHELGGDRSRISTSPGTTTWTRATASTVDLYPNRVIVGSETHPAAIATGWDKVRQASPRDRRLHLDGLGLPRRGRDRPRRVLRRESPRRSTRSWASTRGSPPGAATSTSPATAARCRTTARSSSGLRSDPYVAVRRPQHHGKTARTRPPGRGATPSRRGAGRGTRARPVTVEVYADADEVELVVNGRSLGRRPAGRAHRFRPNSRPCSSPACSRPSPCATARRSAECACALRRARCCSRPRSIVPRSVPTPVTWPSSTSPWSTATGRCTALPTGRSTVEVDGPGVLQAWAAPTPPHRGGFTSAACTTFDGRALAVSARPGRGRSP